MVDNSGIDTLELQEIPAWITDMQEQIERRRREIAKQFFLPPSLFDSEVKEGKQVIDA